VVVVVDGPGCALLVWVTGRKSGTSLECSKLSGTLRFLNNPCRFSRTPREVEICLRSGTVSLVKASAMGRRSAESASVVRWGTTGLRLRNPERRHKPSTSHQNEPGLTTALLPILYGIQYGTWTLNTTPDDYVVAPSRHSFLKQLSVLSWQDTGIESSQPSPAQPTSSNPRPFSRKPVFRSKPRPQCNACCNWIFKIDEFATWVPTCL